MTEKKIPYKIYIEEHEMPKEWYNVRADMKNKPAPLLNPATHKPMTTEELGEVFCDELVKQEMDNDNRYIPIPKKIRDFYLMYRPAPLVRAYCLEEKLQTPAKIYYKFEGNNTSGSHKLNSAIEAFENYVINNYSSAFQLRTADSKKRFARLCMKNQIKYYEQCEATLNFINAMIKDIDQSGYNLRNMVDLIKILSERKVV